MITDQRCKNQERINIIRDLLSNPYRKEGKHSRKKAVWATEAPASEKAPAHDDFIYGKRGYTATTITNAKGKMVLNTTTAIISSTSTQAEIILDFNQIPPNRLLRLAYSRRAKFKSSGVKSGQRISIITYSE